MIIKKIIPIFLIFIFIFISMSIATAKEIAVYSENETLSFYLVEGNKYNYCENNITIEIYNIPDNTSLQVIIKGEVVIDKIISNYTLINVNCNDKETLIIKINGISHDYGTIILYHKYYTSTKIEEIPEELTISITAFNKEKWVISLGIIIGFGIMFYPSPLILGNIYKLYVIKNIRSELNESDK